MQFKQWEATTDQKVFKRVTAKNSQLLTALGLPPSDLHVINTGSFATIYQHPVDPTKIIKATKDQGDINNLVKAQAANSPNVVRLYPINGKMSIPLGKQLHVIIADKVEGESMPYTSNVIAMLIGGRLGMENSKKAAIKIQGEDLYRDKILNHFRRNTEEEKMKLSYLFMTLAQLERYGIHLADFTDNIIDAGDHYVIIDMGQ